MMEVKLMLQKKRQYKKRKEQIEAAEGGEAERSEETAGGLDPKVGAQEHKVTKPSEHEQTHKKVIYQNRKMKKLQKLMIQKKEAQKESD